MHVGDLEVEVVRDGKNRRLRVQGRIYGVESDVTPDELRALAGYLQRAAAAAKEA